ncbi:MAG: S-layer homology domain-containing protein [Clostridia bacterium]|nr:S-layer homology domain-containing protein [Clostridia bacterium]
MKKRLLSLFTCLIFCLGLLPTAALAETGTGDESSSTKTVTDSAGFYAALDNASVTTIVVSGLFDIGTEASTDEPLVIPRDLTIRGDGSGSGFTLRPAGIVLGGDVTFENLSLTFTNAVRNAIIANGYSLTLNSVTRSGNPTWRTHVFLGGVSDPTCGTILPQAGSAGSVVISGVCDLGNLYAGSLSDVGDNATDSPNSFDGTASITIDQSASGTIGEIFAFGARENRSGTPIVAGNQSGDEWVPDASKYPVTGAVAVALKGTAVKTVNGTASTTVTITDNGSSNQFTPKLTGIGGLALLPGEKDGQPSLCHVAPAAGSSLTVDAALNVPENTRLSFEYLEEAAALQVGSLTGGGTLVLEQYQSLEITEAVTGKTEVAIGGVAYDGSSTAEPQVNHGYLLTPRAESTAYSFVLLPTNNSPEKILEFDAANQKWAVPSASATPLQAESFSFVDETISAESGSTSIKLPYHVTYNIDSGFPSTLFLSPAVTVNSTTLNPDENDELHFTELGFSMLFTEGQYGAVSEDYGEYINIYVPTVNTAIPDGTYLITVTIPAQSSSTGSALSDSVVLTVGSPKLTLFYPTLPSTLTAGEPIANITPVVTGGSGSCTYTLTGSLPAGLNFDTTTGVISGTPSAVTAGESVVTVTVSEGSATASTEITLPAVGRKLQRLALALSDSASVAVPTKGTTSTLNLSAAATYADSTDAEDVTEQTTFSLTGTVPGVSLSGHQLTLTPEAAAGSLTVTGRFGGQTASLDIELTKVGAGTVATLGAVSGPDRVNASDVAATAAYTVSAEDPYGAAVPSPAVSWSASGLAGVTVDSAGRLTVPAGCAAGSVTVTATHGSLSVSKTVTVVREAPRAASLTLSRSPSGEVVIPASGSSEVAFSAAVLDQFGAAMDAAAVSWSVTETAGVSIEQTGLLTVDSTAAAGTVTVTAVCQSVTETMNLTLVAATVDPVATTLVIQKNGAAVTADTVSIPGSARYTAVVLDQQGQVMSGETALWVQAALPDGVTFENGLLTVAETAAAGTVTLTAQSGGLSASLAVTLSAKQPHPLQGSFGDRSVTYGQSLAGQTVQCATGQPVYRSSAPQVVSVDAASGAVTVVGAGSAVITATVEETDGYLAASLSYAVTVSPAELLIRCDDTAAAVGSALPALTFTVSGLVGSDQLTTPPTLRCAAEMSRAGTYLITASGAAQSSGNYTIRYLPGTLTVSGLPAPALTLRADKSSLRGGGTVVLTVGGLPQGGAVSVSCDKTSVSLKGSGSSRTATLPNATATYVFTARFAGNEAYAAATASCTVTVTRVSSGGGSGGSSGGGSSSGGSGGGSSGGGSSSGSSGAAVTVPVTTVDRNESGQTVTTTAAAPAASVREGTASVQLSAASGRELVRQAVAEGSAEVVIAPAISGAVSRTEVAIPAASLGDLGRETTAELIISTPVAEVSIGNGGLAALASESGSVTVRAERSGSALTLEISRGGKAVGAIPGGITVTLPHDDCGPGTVAVLVGADGSREVVRRSMADAADGTVTVPLSGSATVELVDNAGRFEDVRDSDWHKGVVDFATAHELFGGVSDTSFLPNEPMTRGMLAQVLHNLENNPAATGSADFIDLPGGQWYTEAVRWAAGAGLVNGYDSGEFGAGDPVTREQLAVILWRYAGQPASRHSLDHFTDLSLVDAYALPALRWANETGVMSGIGEGRLDPKSRAVRVHVAQMLKNYLEAAD